MKVFNLTDVPTSKLQTHGMVGQTIVVGSALLGPGAYAEIVDEKHVREGADFLVSIGAVAFDKLPTEYVVARNSPSTPPVVYPPVAEAGAEPAQQVEETKAEPVKDAPLGTKKPRKGGE